MKRLAAEEQKETRICDHCDREIMRMEIQEEIQQDIIKLQLEAKQGREVVERLYSEQYEKTSRVNQLENELTTAERNQREKEQELMNKLAEEQSKGEKARELVDQLRKALEDSHICEREINDQCGEAEEKLENLRLDEQNLRERKLELSTQIDELSKRLKGSLKLDQVRGTLCQRCVQRLNQIYRPFFSGGAIPEEDSESMISKGSVFDKGN